MININNLTTVILRISLLVIFLLCSNLLARNKNQIATQTPNSKKVEGNNIDIGQVHNHITNSTITAATGTDE